MKHTYNDKIHTPISNKQQFCNEERNAIKPEIIQGYNKYMCYVGQDGRQLFDTMPYIEADFFF